MKIKGKVWKFGDEINTDLIFPHSAFRASPDEQCKLCMSDNRPGWAALVEPGDILIAGANFGTGSSRPGAAVLKRLGLAGMVAESCNGLFYRNCIGYGFAALSVPGVAGMFEEGDIAEVDYSEGAVKNLRTGETRRGNKLSGEMTEIIEAGGIEAVLTAKGYIPKN
ncbi:MAG: 3-isopropylmalate dehydratase small subunit [Oscillospiraceae bacterium]|nr:3-isopropylmalate dehydratase small subunit [Oscillospiraceae bacterium]